MFEIHIKEVKRILQITDNSKDAYITEMLPYVVDYVRDYCDNPELEIRSGVTIAIAKILEFYMNNVSLESRSISRLSETFASDIPPSILTLLKPYNNRDNGKVKFF